MSFRHIAYFDLERFPDVGGVLGFIMPSFLVGWLENDIVGISIGAEHSGKVGKVRGFQTILHTRHYKP